ncbi:hypothetical protein D910_09571 [Dendroctonus ponderosae]|uniref:Uncharacterized protein n=1 Tax=Dendroctonus ponderosae TaxID=77166 RepID=U4UE50_DENPD|nr:hypothetical protein D910_09571 [Dendroctonus ponderosae]
MSTSPKRIWWPCTCTCSATAGCSVCLNLQLLLCSVILVFTLRFMVPIYALPQLHGTLWTPCADKGSRLSLADLKVCWIVVGSCP